MKKMMLSFVFLMGLLSFKAYATQQDPIFLEIGKDIHGYLKQKFGERFTTLEQSKKKVLIQTDMEALPWISMLVHKEFQQCGGYFTFFTEQEARTQFKQRNPEFIGSAIDESLYKLNQPKMVKQLIAGAAEAPIRTVIEELSKFHNRYYNSQTGVDSQHYVKNTWQDILQSRSDAKVEFFQHPRWDQPSVIATINGAKTPDEYIVIGGHADSIAGFWSRASARAPGADDNASGIATITEIMRVLVENNFQPEKSLVFMAYAAEEVGLLGSKEIAQTWKRDGKNVVGVIQLDMTNFQGSTEDIVIITDNTNSGQNDFMAKLLDTYLPNFSWTRDQCGYACSDHASWDAQGYPVSAPFEARKSKMNRNIHTKNDTIAKSGGNATHALKFAQLTLAFIAEMDR